MQTTNGTPADDERDPVTGESASEGYTPPQDAPIPLATPRPKIKTLDKKKVGIIAGIAGVLIAFAFVQAFMQKPNQNKPKEQPPTANMSTKPEAFNALPGDYATAAQQRAERAPKLGPPMPGEVGQMQYAAQQQASTRAYGGGAQPQTAAQQFAAQQDLQRMQQAANARYAKTSFQQSAGAGGTSNQSQFGGQPGFGGMPPDSPEAVQQQMLAQAAAAAAGAGGPDKTARDDANRQDDKRHFMDEKRDTGTLQSRLTPPATPTVVSAGTLIPALFLTGINSDLPGQITAQVSQPVYDTPTGRYVIIPQGSVLIGAYDSRVTFGQNRVLLVWQRLRFPNGSSLDLEGMPGVDLSGYAGVSDKVNNHWGKVLSSVLLSSTVAAGGGAPPRAALVGWLLLVPALGFYVAFVVWPLIQGVQYSFYDWNGIGVARWVGVDNYLTVFTDPDLLGAIRNAFILIAFFTFIPVGLGLVLSTLIRGIRNKAFAATAQTVLFLPQIIPLAAAGIAWSWMYAQTGAVNQILGWLGLGWITRPWLADYGTALPAVGLIGSWVLTGLCTVLLLTGLGKIDVSLYEAIRLDGAGWWREFFTITLPGLRQEIAVLVTVTVIAALSSFDIIYTSTQGGPGRATLVPGLSIFRIGFTQSDVGLASAFGIVLMVLVLVVVLPIQRLSRASDS